MRSLLPLVCLSPSGQPIYEGRLARAKKGGWHVFVFSLRGQRSAWSADLGLKRNAQIVHGSTSPRIKIGQLWSLTVWMLYLQDGADHVLIVTESLRVAPDQIGLRHYRVPLAAVVGLALATRPGSFLRSFTSYGMLVSHKLRAALADATRVQPCPRTDYENWLARFDDWSDRRLQKLSVPHLPPGAVRALVFAQRKGSALQATIRSLKEQVYGLADVIVLYPGMAIPAKGAEFTLLLQAGEVIAWHALPLLAEALQHADAAYSDHDRVDKNGGRKEPSFKPQPGYMTMCSGLLSKAAWLVRSDLLEPGSTPAWAECCRLELWFRLEASGYAVRTVRVPHLLIHLRDDVETAPAAALAAQVSQALRTRGIDAQVRQTSPLRLMWRSDHLASVDIIIPSRLRGALQVDCILRILRNTSHTNFRMHVVVSQPHALDTEQRRIAERIKSAGAAHIISHVSDSFNFAAVNNYVASRTSGPLICLLNDDVEPLDPEWLGRMAAMFSHPKTGIVGARLCYPDGRIQHGGVIMGLAGLAEHANRFLESHAQGYMGRAQIDQEMSAVTGACLIIRRDVFALAGGFDEVFASGFNDVDLCLRVRELGYSVIMAASTTLVHHESVSYEHHFGHDQEAELAAARIMWDRWPSVIASDPYHNPNLSLLPNSEWELADPPRT